MTEPHVVSRQHSGLDDVGSLNLPFRWRVDARNTRVRSLATRPWHDEDLHVPLETISVDPARVLYWDNDPERENSPRRIAYMMASRAIPLTIEGGNNIRNMVDHLRNTETADEIGYSYSRIDLAKRVLAQLQIAPGERKGSLQRANLQVSFRYTPPEGDALDALVNVLRSREES